MPWGGSIPKITALCANCHYADATGCISNNGKRGELAKILSVLLFDV